MFNPLRRLELNMIDPLRAQSRYLVSQQYPRGIPPGQENDGISLLVTRYSDRDHAKVHLDAVKKDKYAALIDLEEAKHRLQLQAILVPGATYLVYIDLVRDHSLLDQHTRQLTTQHLCRYIEEFTTWRLRDLRHLQCKLHLVFGEWRVQLQFSRQVLTVSLSDIEAVT